MISFEGVILLGILLALIGAMVWFIDYLDWMPGGIYRWVMIGAIALVLFIIVPTIFRVVSPGLGIKGPAPIEGQLRSDAANFKMIRGQIATFTVGIDADECTIDPPIQQRDGVRPIADIPCNMLDVAGKSRAYSWEVFFDSALAYTITARNAYFGGLVGGPERKFKVILFEDLKAQYGTGTTAPPGASVRNPGDPAAYKLDVTTKESPQGLARGKFALKRGDGTVRDYYAVYIPPGQTGLPIGPKSTIYTDGTIVVDGRPTAQLTANGRTVMETDSDVTIDTGNSGVWYVVNGRVKQEWCEALRGLGRSCS